jgi:hypothetical protein
MAAFNNDNLLLNMGNPYNIGHIRHIRVPFPEAKEGASPGSPGLFIIPDLLICIKNINRSS